MPLKQTEIDFKVKKSGRLRNKENINLHTRSNSKLFQIALISIIVKPVICLESGRSTDLKLRVFVRTCIYTFAIHSSTRHGWGHVGSLVASRAIDVNVCGSSPAHSS